MKSLTDSEIQYLIEMLDMIITMLPNADTSIAKAITMKLNSGD